MCPDCWTPKRSLRWKVFELGRIYFSFSYLNSRIPVNVCFPGPITTWLCFSSVQFSSVAQSCLTLCDPMNRSTPGLPVHHQLPEFTQIHVHQVSDAIQPSHPLSSPSPPAPNPSQHQSFSNESTLCVRWPKYWSFSFSIIPSKEIRRPSYLQLKKKIFIWANCVV